MEETRSLSKQSIYWLLLRCNKNMYKYSCVYTWMQIYNTCDILISCYFDHCLLILFKGQWTFLTILTFEFPVSPLYLPSHQERSHFLCFASFLCTPDYSHSWACPLHFLSLSLISSYFCHFVHFPFKRLSLSVKSMFPALSEGDTCRNVLIVRYSRHAYTKRCSWWHWALCISGYEHTRMKFLWFTWSCMMSCQELWACNPLI